MGWERGGELSLQRVWTIAKRWLGDPGLASKGTAKVAADIAANKRLVVKDLAALAADQRRQRVCVRRSALSQLALFALAVIVPAGTRAAGPNSSGIISYPSDKLTTSAGGVDMRTGRYIYSVTDLSIGDPNEALVFTRIMPRWGAISGLTLGNFSTNWDYDLRIIRFSRTLRDQQGGYPPGNDYAAFVSDGLSMVPFAASSTGTAYGQEGNGTGLADLSFTGQQGTSNVVYTYTQTDGTQVQFKPLGVISGGTVTDIYPVKITRADGTVYSLGYVAYAAGSSYAARLTSVTSSRGYALRIEGGGSLITKACTLNLAVTTLAANPFCPASAATVSYTYLSGNLSEVQGPDGVDYQFSYATVGTSRTMTFKRLTSSGVVSTVTNTLIDAMDTTFGQNAILSYDAVSNQTFSTGETYDYQWQHQPLMTGVTSTIAGGYVTDRAGKRISVLYLFPAKPGTGPGSTCTHYPCSPVTIGSIPYLQTEGPVTVLDQLGHGNTYDFCDPGVKADPPPGVSDCYPVILQSMTDSAGITTKFTFDNFRNVTEARQLAVPGSALSDLVQSAAYDCSTTFQLCTKPIWTKTLGGERVDYTYKSWGGLETQMQPPPAAGSARPLKLYAYLQLSANIKDAGGTLVSTNQPVWLMLSDTACQTVANSSVPTCDNTKPKVVTTYEYGSSGAANNLLLRGTVVTANSVSLRTCFGYDAYGNRISETKPLGTSAAACQ